MKRRRRGYGADDAKVPGAVRTASLALVALLSVPGLLLACSGDRGRSSAVAAGAEPDGGMPADAGGADASAERPFASSAADATSMISAVVDGRQREIAACVRDFRARKDLARERVTVSFGIDQEGRLLGVTSKGKDAELERCVHQALADAPFPRSHAGIINVVKTYEERLQ